MNNGTIGFIGLGVMGKPMAKNLVRKGYSLIVFDIKHSMSISGAKRKAAVHLQTWPRKVT